MRTFYQKKMMVLFGFNQKNVQYYEKHIQEFTWGSADEHTIVHGQPREKRTTKNRTGRDINCKQSFQTLHQSSSTIGHQQ